MIKFYYSLFYWIYKWESKKEKDSMSLINTLLSISFLNVMNFVTILLVTEIVLNFQFGSFKIISLGSFIIFVFLNYFGLLFKKKYLKIIEKLEFIEKDKRNTARIFSILYIISSFLLICFALILYP